MRGINKDEEYNSLSYRELNDRNRQSRLNSLILDKKSNVFRDKEL